MGSPLRAIATKVDDQPTLTRQDELIGRTLNGRFLVKELIGAGGMGRVYRAVQKPLDRMVALKVLAEVEGAANGARTQTLQKRFFVEAALTSKLTHPNTVKVFDYGCTEGGILYIAMEYLEGQTLSDLVGRKGPLPWPRVIGIGQQICRSLREAHKLGVVHRDLKPANVMLLASDTDEDQVKVLDFGLVKSFIAGAELAGQTITKHGTLMGSPQYMSPEQAKSERVDPRSDVYSLGIVLYEALAGKPPFQGKSHIDVILKHISQRPAPFSGKSGDPAIPQAVEALVLRCLEKKPQDRFQSMDEVLGAMYEMGALTTPLYGIGPLATARAAALPAPASERRSPIRRWWPAAAAGLGLVAATALFLSRPGKQAPRPTAPLATAASPLVSPALRPSENALADAPTSELRNIHFRVQSEPTGAQVSLGGKSLGATPLDLELPPSADGRAKADLSFSMPGYQTMTVTAGGLGPTIEVTQRLRAVPKRGAKAKKRRA